MSRFGSVFPFAEAGRHTRHIGRLVANFEFVKALLTWGHFDEYVFANPSPTNLRTFEQMLADWLPADRRARVRCLSYPALAQALEAEPFDVFHLGGWGAFMPGLHALRARHASNPWPITGVTHSLNGRGVIDDAVRVTHAGMAPYDAIFCTSTDGREAMRRLLDRGAAISGRPFLGQLEHVPLGIDDAVFDTAGDRSRARSRLRVPDESVVLLVLGRVTPAQKMDLSPLLRVLAWQVLPHTSTPVHLVVAGGAAPEDLKLVTEAAARYGIADHLRFHANFPVEQKPDLLAAADVLVSPVDNTQETFGLSVVEALAAGLPVVASRFDGYKDLVDDGVDGYLIDTYRPPADPTAEWFELRDPNVAQLAHAQGVVIDADRLADRLLRLVQDADLRRRMGRAGREKADRTYRWSRVIGRYESVWQRLSGEARSTALTPLRDAEPLYNFAPHVLFSHYASGTLAPGDRLIARRGVPGDAPYADTGPVLRGPLLRSVLERTRHGTTVSALLDEGLAPADDIWAAVAWLLKYALVSIDRH